MVKIRISAVKYANTYPFIYGLYESGFYKKVILETDHPSDCAEKLLTGKADIGLVPVGVLPFLKKYNVISNYCIGSNGNVRTVQLLSNSPFDEIRRIYLDYRSRTSVNLIKVLAAYKWKKKFDWVNTSPSFDFSSIGHGEAVVLIGDQCFEFEQKFRYNTDLAYAWKCYTGMPFVFACWTAGSDPGESFISEFNDALRAGVENIDNVVKKFGDTGTIRHQDLKKYLTENIDYILNSEKQKAMDLFLELMGKL